MSTHWCYTRDGRTTFGPVTWRELRRMASKGELLPSDVVGHVGMPRSMRAGGVAGLFAPDGQPGSPVEALGTGDIVAAVHFRGSEDRAKP
jgi:hypothetical protein